MYLYVEFLNSWGAYNETMMGFPANNYRRIKKIKLTDEQIKELQPKIVGTNGGKDIFETVSVISIQED